MLTPVARDYCNHFYFGRSTNGGQGPALCRNLGRGIPCPTGPDKTDKGSRDWPTVTGGSCEQQELSAQLLRATPEGPPGNSGLIFQTISRL